MPEAQHAMTNGHCFLQLWWGGCLRIQGVHGAKPGSSRDPTVYISRKMPKIHARGPFTLDYNFVSFVD